MSKSLLALPAYTEASEYGKVVMGETTVRCNTVNSILLPKRLLQRYELEADQDTGLFSSSVPNSVVWEVH